MTTMCHPDDLVTCPYCKSPKTHTIRFKRLHIHLNEMRKIDPSLAKKAICKFNSLHVVDKEELDDHYIECPDNTSSRTAIDDTTDETSYSEMSADEASDTYNMTEDTGRKMFCLTREQVRPVRLGCFQPPQPQILMDPKYPVGMKPPEVAVKKVPATATSAFSREHLRMDRNGKY